jgi:hypothetical protein
LEKIAKILEIAKLGFLVYYLSGAEKCPVKSRIWSSGLQKSWL